MDDCLPVINQEPLLFTAHVISLLNIISNFIMVDPTGNYYLPSMLTWDYDFPFFLHSLKDNFFLKKLVKMGFNKYFQDKIWRNLAYPWNKIYW